MLEQGTGFIFHPILRSGCRNYSKCKALWCLKGIWNNCFRSAFHQSVIARNSNEEEFLWQNFTVLWLFFLKHWLFSFYMYFFFGDEECFTAFSLNLPLPSYLSIESASASAKKIFYNCWFHFSISQLCSHKLSEPYDVLYWTTVTF